MKFKLLLIFFILVLACFVSAQEVEMNLEKQEYSPGQTVQLYLTFNQLPLNKPNAGDLTINGFSTGFFLNNISSNEYLTYFNIPKETQLGNYSIQYNSKFKNGILQDLTFTKNLIVSNKTPNTLSIKPAFILLNEKEDFRITLNSYDSPIEANLIYDSNYFSTIRESLDLSENDEKTFYLSTKKFPENQTISNLNINEYKIPVYFLKEESVDNETKIIENETEVPVEENQTITFPKEGLYLKAPIAYLNKTAAKNIDFEGFLNITNTIDYPLHNLTLTLTGNLKEIVELDYYQKEIINPKETLPLKVLINKYKSPELSKYDGAILLNSTEGLSDYFIISMTFTNEKEANEITEEEVFTNTEEQSETLPSDLDLEKYLVTQDDSEQEKKKNVTLITWIISIIVIVLIVLIFLMMRKKTTVKQTLDDYVSNIKK